MIVFVFFFGLALSRDFYNATTPDTFAWHTLLRKSYSVVAFAVVGFCYRKALAEHGEPVGPLQAATIVAAYSALIEVAQYFGGAQESLTWNAVDVICGALGGAVAGLIPLKARARPRH